MKQALAECTENLSDRARERLSRFEQILTRWNARINLVAQRDLAMLWPRHIRDSLQLLPLIPDGRSITDLGSGAGFPGLILAMCTNNPVTLIESDSRKASFLHEAARETQTRVSVCNSRVEQAAVPPAGIITARALAALPQLLRWSAPLLRPDGFCLFPKGSKAEDEVIRAKAEWCMTIVRYQSQTDLTGTILALSDIHPVKKTAPSPL